MSEIDTQLKQAYRLVKNGEKQRALNILTAVLRTDRNNANAWWLVAHASTDKDQQIQALEQVLRLKPDHTKASQMLDQLLPVDEDPFIDLFDDGEDPFSGVSSASTYEISGKPLLGDQPRQVVVTKSKGTNPIVLFFAFIGVVIVGGCAFCLFATVGSVGFIDTVVEEVLENTTFEPGDSDFDFSFNSGELEDAVDRGTIEQGQTRTGNVDTFENDAWTFSGSEGSEIMIELNETDGLLDPELFLFGANGELIAENDDINLSSGNYNSLIQVRLPRTEIYTIVVSAFGSGGTYELTVSNVPR